jgi:hypothetical protein
MASLTTTSGFADPDAAYRLIVEAHRGLSDDEAAGLSAALVLVLANHIGDMQVLREALEAARRSLPRARSRGDDLNERGPHASQRSRPALLRPCRCR